MGGHSPACGAVVNKKSKSVLVYSSIVYGL